MYVSYQPQTKFAEIAPRGSADAMRAPANGAQITFFTHGLCPYAQRVALALNLKGLAHELIEIDLSNKPSWYEQRLGTSLVPAIELDGSPFTESLDICRLVDDRFTEAPALLPKDKELRKAVEALIMHGPRLESAGWRLLGGSWSFPRKSRPSDAVRRGWEGAVDTLTTSVRQHGGPFLVGDSPTLADVALAPFIARFELAASVCCSYDTTGELREYLDALEALDAWRATFPERDAFGRAISRYGSLDYFDFHTATLAQPMPE